MAKLERTYNVPLRKEYRKAPKYKRAKKAVKALREFIAKHMKAALDNVKIGKYANLEIWKKGIKNPPHHIKVLAVKEEEKVNVELVGAPVVKKPEVKGKKTEEKKEVKKAEEKPAEKEKPKEAPKAKETKEEVKTEEKKPEAKKEVPKPVEKKVEPKKEEEKAPAKPEPKKEEKKPAETKA